MPAAQRVGDQHGCGAVNSAGSADTFINGLAAHRFGDADSHGATMIEASVTVFVNGLGLCRLGDRDSGHLTHGSQPQTTGSPNVFVDG